MTVTSSNFERVANELYETEYWATFALLRRFSFVGSIVWEPSAGNHKIADILRVASGAHTIITSDIETYNRRHDFTIDFLNSSCYVPPHTDIITNPPYGKQNRQAVQFIRLALRRCVGTVAMLLTAKFDHGSSRVDLFRDNPRFAGKITLINRISWFAGDKGTEDHAWFVWRSIGAKYEHPRIWYEGDNRS